MSQDPALAAYFEDAASWDADRVAQTARSARVAWIVASVGWVCALVSALGVALLTPLKTVVPFVIRVDNTTGVVDVVPQYAGTAPMPETTTRMLLRHYVEVCERYVYATAENDYHDCGAFNSGQRNQQWAALWALSNPNSPLNLYRDTTTVSISITSVSFFKRANGLTDLAQVRYVKTKRASDSGEGEATRWIATIQYAYGKPAKDNDVRQWNPIGFRVLDFRAEPETSGDLHAPAALTPSPAKERS